MPSPFPGMDPYLEAPHIWEDFHHSLAYEIRRQLAPQLRPKYVAVVEPRVTYDEVAIARPQLIKPDVAVVRVDDHGKGGLAVAIPPAPLVSITTLEEPIRLFTVEIRDVVEGTLVTAIEILSPVNKRRGHDAYEDYLRKRRALLRSPAHLIEVDLVRGGERWQLLTALPNAPYFVFLSHADRRPQVEIWPLRFQESIPIIPVPLREEDSAVPLDLGLAIQTIYDTAAYDLRIKYNQPPPPPSLSSDDTAWIAERLRAAGLKDWNV